MQLLLNTNSIADYELFLKVKQLPSYNVRGHCVSFPDEYSDRLKLAGAKVELPDYTPSPHLFDYQAAIAATAIRKRKFAVFADCGLGKTLILWEFARYAASVQPDKCFLIVSPLMVIPQTCAEIKRFYGVDVQVIPSGKLTEFLTNGSGIGITNWEAMRDGLPQGRLGGLAGDETSMLKSHYGKWGRRFIELGRGLDWKLALTGTPAPNDRIEYANHAVFLDQFTTVNSFLAKYFVNRGQTDNRWELKPHALRPFYRSLSHWCIFLTDPSVYGWAKRDVPPINVHIHSVPLTDEQESLVRGEGGLFTHKIGGICSRARLSTLAKGHFKGKRVATNKPAFIKSLVGDESTIIWCLYNEEQQILTETLPDAASITGTTPHAERMRLIDEFKAGRIKVLISKPKILGFGLNLQIATRQIFSGLQDSYESYYQAVKRSNRYGSTQPLEVHIPVADIERPMIETVLKKAKRVYQDTQEQELLFKEVSR